MPFNCAYLGDDVTCSNSYFLHKRLQRILLKLQKFDFIIEFKKSTEMYFLDTLSRVFLITDTYSVEENMRDIHNINHRTQLLNAISDELSSKIKGP